ncbi:MAG: FtsX-like permease family protein [Lachnospiraceae bacterium]|jgi:predicted lysophospholipase L1 biosynthesis ABC-type transport system permease subunit|nr:FtsX-like permease family protein [Lachnospiraceae bacterium]
MIIGIKNASKLIGISIIACCAVLVCTMFLNFYLDIRFIEGDITSELSRIFYDAQVSTAKVVCLVTGGCLLLTSAVMLMFYVKHYIDTHKKELGILKALGYSNLKVAENFWVFGISALTGTAVGFGGAFLLMPEFYALQNEDKMLPEIAIRFHPVIFLYFVILPTVGFSLLAVGYAWYKLKQPVLRLLKNDFQAPTRTKALTFFILFSSFCFSSMTQMSFSMKDLSSEMMGAMMLIIGLILAFTTLFLAIATVMKGRTKTIAMMRALGYSQRECCRTVLGRYRPVSYIGFAIGTVYQYALLRFTVDIVFKDVEGIPVYQFDFPVMLVSLAVFIILYEILMFVTSEKIKRISVKEIMTE